MKSRAEVSFLAVSFALLVGLVVPVSAAVIDSTGDASTATAVAGTAPTGAAFFVQGAPQPLLLMAIGALVVLIPVTRRALRGAPVSTTSPVERAPN